MARIRELGRIIAASGKGGQRKRPRFTNYEGNREAFFEGSNEHGDIGMSVFLSDEWRFKLYPIYSTLDAQHYRSSIPKGES